MRRIKHKEIAEVREQLLKDSHNTCTLCGCPLDAKDAVLDHCHSSGVIRGSIHRSCNALLGKIENNYKRVGMSELQLLRFLEGTFDYLFTDERYLGDDLLHPLHKKKQVSQFRKLKAQEQILELIKLGVYREENPPRNQEERVKVYSKLI